ncbi:MAG: C40 family peptidase [Pseudomonadota bacterium]
MSDPRILPANGRVAHVSLQGHIAADRFVEGRWTMIQQPMANMLDAPGGSRVSQLLFGERFLVLEAKDGVAFGQAERDGYVGYITSAGLTEPVDTTHWVSSPATHLYPRPDMKAPPDVSIFFGSAVHVTGEREAYRRIHTGHWVPAAHLQPLRVRYGDTVGVADLLLGTPYLWGGNSRWGIDCSGLIQTAFLACGMPCPRDSDQQLEVLGRELDRSEELARGDLVFWDGHVGIMANENMILHANAHHMSVAYEPLREAVTRIAAQGEGGIVARRRLS